MTFKLSKIKNKFAVSDHEPYREKIKTILFENNIKIIVLDDDPTGMQTVHGCLVLTAWSRNHLINALNHNVPVFYILTNTRSHNKNMAENIITDIITEIITVTKDMPFKILIISRSDSTLRGHFPLEPVLIKKLLQKQNIDFHYPVFFIPALLEAGRYTYDNKQYIVSEDCMIPVSDTEFARDRFFGYKSSNLFEYIREKTNNKIHKNEIASFSISDLRHFNISSLTEKIEKNKKNKFFIINALDYYDLWKFSFTILNLLVKKNSSAVFRTSSSFVKAISGIENIALLKKNDMIEQTGPGLFLAGSYTEKTSSQLKQIFLCRDVIGIELDVITTIKNPISALHELVTQVKKAVERKKTPVIFTSRKIIQPDNKNQFLDVGAKISSVFIDLVKNLPYIPSYVVVKGGITAHNVLAKGFNIETAAVTGQILPGIPVVKIKTKQSSTQMPLIIFPGNVGTSKSLLNIFEILH